ncbi:tsn-1 [Pristionchus pacificus]|nr:tsn-1 [Pristionchus pacificus]
MASEGVSMRRGLVKQVLSGDSVVIQGAPRPNGPPEETTVYLSNVSAPRMGKRPTETVTATPDEPFAWQAREWLRKKLVGQMVTFIKEFTATSSRDHGKIYLGGTSVETAENVNETAVAEGWLEVRQGKVTDEFTSKLLDLQEKAKSAKIGRWSDNTDGAVRDIKWTFNDPRSLVDFYKQKPVDAVIEQVRDGSTVRAFLLPRFEYITLQLSGVRSPSTRAGNDGVEAFANEAKFFAEARVLQQDVQIVLESVSNNNFVGSILHPKGNIAEALVREGLAKCVDWSIGLCTGGAEGLRAAENQAKMNRKRMWATYKPSAGNLAEKKKFDAKVIEIVLNDAMIVVRDNGEESKVYLSSVRLPRDAGDRPTAAGRQFRPLYDIPYMYECREYLRKKLIGKKVSVTVDYHQPKSDQFPEKTCCTIEAGGANVAIGLLERGLSKVVRHRNDDENRSSQYDALLAAEAKAEKEQKGLFAVASKEEGNHTQRVQELQGDLARSKQFLPYLQRGARAEGIVEFLTSGSRMRIYVPKETCLLTFLLGGINCPKGARAGANGQTAAAAEPFSEEAAKFTRKLCMHREVELEVEGLDKQGAFIGYLWVRPEDGGRHQNLSELLLEQGLATLHFTAEKSAHYNHMSAAETRAKNAKRNIWATWTDTDAEAKEEEAANQKTERTVNYKKVAVSDVGKNGNSFRISAQSIEDGPKLERLMEELRVSVANSAAPSNVTVKRGEMVAAKFSADKQWYRAKVESVRAGQADVLYVDFGNRETISTSDIAALPGTLSSVPASARDYYLALVSTPNDDDYTGFALTALQTLLSSNSFAEINVEYSLGGAQYAQVLVEINGEKVDVGKALIEDGFAMADKRREQRLQKLVSAYDEAEKKARKERANIWEFGDFTGNEI